MSSKERAEFQRKIKKMPESELVYLVTGMFGNNWQRSLMVAGILERGSQEKSRWEEAL